MKDLFPKYDQPLVEVEDKTTSPSRNEFQPCKTQLHFNKKENTKRELGSPGAWVTPPPVDEPELKWIRATP